MKKSKSAGSICAAGLIAGAPFFLPGTPADAGEGGAFVGGLVAGHIVTNAANRSERRTRAAEHQAYQQQQQQQQAPAQKAEPTVEERLATLDKLAANGMITKEEYDRRRQAILDDL